MIDFIFLKIPFITYIASLAVIIPIILGIITVKNWIKTPLQIIFLYCIIHSFFESVAWYYVFNHEQNHFLNNTLTYVDTVFLGYYYYCLSLNSVYKKVISVINILAISIILWSHFTTGRDYNRIDSFAHSISNISLIGVSLLFFYQLLNNLDVKNLFSYSYFWINVAILIYFSGVFFVDIFAEFITFNKDESITQFWNTKDYLLFFHHIFLAIGLWFSKTPPQLSPSSK